MKLSIIIPYYETYEYTEKLLNALQPQIVDNVEVIVVDDGCNETRLDAFDFIKLVHLDKNYGASYAWNVGLSLATGEYIGFIDSDDMVTPDYIDTLLKAIDQIQADEIVFDFYVCRKDKRIFLTKRAVCRAIWKAIYKRWLVIPFDESRLYKTALPLHLHLKNTEHSKIYLDIPLYYYTQDRENSITWRAKHGLFTANESNHKRRY